jgi:hypothetical protein
MTTNWPGAAKGRLKEAIGALTGNRRQASQAASSHAKIVLLGYPFPVGRICARVSAEAKQGRDLSHVAPAVSTAFNASRARANVTSSGVRDQQPVARQLDRDWV